MPATTWAYVSCPKRRDGYGHKIGPSFNTAPMLLDQAVATAERIIKAGGREFVRIYRSAVQGPRPLGTSLGSSFLTNDVITEMRP